MQAVNNNNANEKAEKKVITMRVLSYVFLGFLTFLSLVFFYLLIIESTLSKQMINSSTFYPYPREYLFTNIHKLFTDPVFKQTFNAGRGFINSLVIALSSSVLTCYFSALTAYGIYAYDFKLKKIAEGFILAIMMIPSQLSSVGFYQLAIKLGLKNNFWVLIIPSIAAPATFFYMIQYLRATLPKDLLEASRMDGSSEFGTFNRIVLPIMKPALAVQFIFSFVGSWNNLYMPALLLTEPDLKTLPVMISGLNAQAWGDKDNAVIYVAILFSIIPVVIVYIVLSKFIIKGVTAGSVKG